jgi:AmiR/NasT family two-component response regulator
MNAKLQERLSRLRVATFCEPGMDTELLIRHLQRSRAALRHIWPIPERISADADLLIFDYVQGLTKRLPWPPGEPGAALVIVLPNNGAYSLTELQGMCADAVLHRSAPLHAIETAMMLALDHFAFIRRLRNRIERVEENVRAIRTIEKAKQLLMSLHGIDEEKAFQMLRDLAMKKRLTIASLAGRLIDSGELLTYQT